MYVDSLSMNFLLEKRCEMWKTIHFLCGRNTLKIVIVQLLNDYSIVLKSMQSIFSVYKNLIISSLYNILKSENNIFNFFCVKKCKKGCSMSIFGVQMLEFVQKGDDRGHLVIIEGMKEIPFDIKRVFYIYGSDSHVVRGQHANKKTEFVLVNVAGTSKVKVRDGKGNEAVFSLNRPHTGIYLPKMVWKDMYDFSSDSVLLCLASDHYDASEYIRNYDEFVCAVNTDKDN